MEMRQAEVEIEWEGRKETVVVRELTFGEHNEVLSKSLKVRNVGGLSQVDFDIATYRKEVMKKAIVKAPFDKNRIDDIPLSVANKIWEKIAELNPLME